MRFRITGSGWRLEELEAKAKPPEPKKPFVPMTDAEWIDEMHQMRERRMNHASNFHPDDLRAMERACPTSMMKEIALRDARAPTGRPGAIPNSQQPTSPRSSAGDGTGWGAATPIGPPPGLRYVDAQLDAQDAKDRAERVRQDAQLTAMDKLAEQTEAMKKQTEALAKLTEQMK
jgi:hypothetical protein